MTGVPPWPDALAALDDPAVRRAAGHAIAFAPGRVNLMGDHTDYLGGPVLPMPVECGTWVVAGRASLRGVRARSANRPAGVRIAPGAMASRRDDWGDFVRGAWLELAAIGAPVDAAGLDVVVAGNIPGGGLSSSASLSAALVHAMATAIGFPLPAPLAVAQLCRRIETGSVGLQCGLMDQAAVCLGEPGAALAFDCASLDAHPVAIHPALTVVVVDSGVPRVLAHAPYNERQREARAALAVLEPDLAAPDTPLAALAAAIGRLDPARLPAALRDPLRRRLRHVASEWRRPLAMAGALASGDGAAAGALMDASHASLRDDFEVSCAPVDRLCDGLRATPGVHGARMTGAGFGGAVVATVATAQAAAVLAQLPALGARLQLPLRGFIARSPGAARSGWPP